MRKISISVIALAIVAVIFIAGEAYAYLPQDRGFSSDASVNDSTIDYSIGAEGAYVGSATLIDNGDLLPVKELYIYRDPSYRSNVNEGNITAIGSQVFTQDYYIDQLTRNLNFRGMTDIKILNATELKEKLLSDMPSVSQKGLIIISGAIPDTVFGPSTTILEKWIDAGGFLYWAGNVIGRDMSTPDDIVEVNKQNAMIGTSTFCGWLPAASYDTELRSKFCYESQRLEFAPNTTTIASAAKIIFSTKATSDFFQKDLKLISFN